MVDVPPVQGTFGIKDARIVAPRHPGRSTLCERASRRGPGQMPPPASSVVDDEAVNLLREWISQPGPAAEGTGDESRK